MSGRDLLLQGLSLLEVPDIGRVAPLLERYIAEIEKWNPRFGLVKAEGDELVIKHALDSLSAWRIVRDLAAAASGAGGGSVVDVGSGAGFPGIPLAVALPSVSFTLMERSAKRAAFLKNCAVLLGLANVIVLESDLQAAAGEFSVATFRAFAPLDRFFRDLSRSRVRCRSVVAYKGRAETAREELDRIRGFEVVGSVDILRVKVPFMEEERHIVTIGMKP
jgi:16S rRNA (guanine527-N7)-methyltransferase